MESQIDESEYTFYIKSLKGKVLTKLIETIKQSANEINCYISPTCIKMIHIDPSRTACTYVKLYQEKFEKYYCPEKTLFALNVKLLFKIFKAISKDDILTMYIKKEDTTCMYINMSNSILNKTKVYELPLLEGTSSETTFPEQSYECYIEMSSKEFQKTIKEMYSLKSKTIEITSIDDELKMSCTDGNAKIETSIIQPDEINQYKNLESVNENGPDGPDGPDGDDEINVSSNCEIIQGKYKLIYLVNFIKATQICDMMRICIKNDHPLILEYDVGDLGSIRLILDPIIT
jgi:proliferating cell nuclear antigen